LLADSNDGWVRDLPVHNLIGDSGNATDVMAGKTVLLTGAGGCIGSAVAKAILSGKPRQVLLLDHSEQALYQLGRSLSSLDEGPPYRLVPGDVGDLSLIAELLEEFSPDLILHAAAYKHVPLMEANPFAAMQNNAIFTWQLAKVAAETGVPQLLLISTDKAANPRSILGASKRIAEQAVLRWSSPLRRYAAIRLVNVLGSSGSVAPLFVEQIRRGGPLTITHPDAARYFMTLEDTVRLIMAAATLPGEGVVFLPKLSEPVRIVELARVLLRHTAGSDTIRTEYTALRPGEKLVEDLLSANESLRLTLHPGIHALTSPRPSDDVFDRTLFQLGEIVQRRDLALLLETLCLLVPDYQPGSTLCPARQMAHD
jgi:FlaA1/EpsC-like NDP-sugar epimerase